MQRECKFCDDHQQVIMEKPPGADKWTVTNLDGSFHRHVKYNAQPAKQETVTITESVSKPMVTHEEEAKITASLRSEAIAKAHDENMDAAEKNVHAMNELKQAIDSLADGVLDTKYELHEINNNIKSLTSIVAAYITTFKK